MTANVHTPETIAANLAAFRQDDEIITYDILTVDASGKPAYAFYVTSAEGVTLDDVKAHIARISKNEWNKDKTFHIIKKVTTHTYEVI